MLSVIVQCIIFLYGTIYLFIFIYYILCRYINALLAELSWWSEL